MVFSASSSPEAPPPPLTPHHRLQKASIIPNILPTSFIPTLELAIWYPKTHDTVSLGNVIPPSNMTSKPHYLALPLSNKPSATIKNATYTLVLSDPDATSRAEPVKGQMCHWIITGLKASSKSAADYAAEEQVNDAMSIELPDPNDFSLETTSEQNTTTIVSYLPPTPPPKTSYHRYVFVLLSDEGKGHGKLEKPKDRPHWGFGEQGKGVMDWAQENGLVPVGANFLYSENDEQ